MYFHLHAVPTGNLQLRNENWRAKRSANQIPYPFDSSLTGQAQSLENLVIIDSGVMRASITVTIPHRDLACGARHGEHAREIFTDYRRIHGNRSMKVVNVRQASQDKSGKNAVGLNQAKPPTLSRSQNRPQPGHTESTSTRSHRIDLNQVTQNRPQPGHTDSTSTRSHRLDLNQVTESTSTRSHRIELNQVTESTSTRSHRIDLNQVTQNRPQPGHTDSTSIGSQNRPDNQHRSGHNEGQEVNYN
jgi:hypothetical protein